MKVLSICTGMGLLDRAFKDEGFDVVAGCEIDSEMRTMYEALCGEKHLTHDLNDLIDLAEYGDYRGVIGGPPCQSLTKLRAIRKPKFNDLTPLVGALLNKGNFDFYLFENVAPLNIENSERTFCNAMHFYKPHQSRSRWFTHSQNIYPPKPLYSGSVDELMAYPAVAGRIYGPKRGAKLQGYDGISKMSFPCVQLQKGLANAVSYPLARAWARSIKNYLRML